ncbi:MAG: alkaline phosphatase family protein [Spirochaetales bacterium]|nr:alkaline phosphatase family protein [Spirochaetales bacterium]
MLFRLILAGFLVAPGACRSTFEDLPGDKVTRIGFGSCARQDEPQPIWDDVLSANPDLFILMGDNVYADTIDMGAMRRAYQRFGEVPGFKKLRQARPVIATWDDHDYGANDAGAEYPRKDEAQRIFLDFFHEPQASARRNSPGVYASYYASPGSPILSAEPGGRQSELGPRIQIILLDTRYFRDALHAAPDSRPGKRRYLPHRDSKHTLLGSAQWQWLEKELRQPAEIRIVVSSIQVLPVDHPGERWDTFPHERTRLFQLLRAARSQVIVLLSGDRHYGEISRLPAGRTIDLQRTLPYEHSSVAEGDLVKDLYEITSSSLTSPWHEGSLLPNRFRLTGTRTHAVPNFGLLQINWTQGFVRAQLRGPSGILLESVGIPFSGD